MISFSELEMSDAFEIILKSSTIRGIPQFDLLYKEVASQQGIPDFVGLTSNYFINKYNFEEISSIESASLILSFLKRKSGRRWKYLKEHTSLSDTTLNRILKELLAHKYITIENNLYYLAVTSIPQGDNIWAFELKLSNWKRALFQALQYKAFANYVVVVFPFEKENILRQNLTAFAEMNVGVLLFDANYCRTKWIRRPRKESPISKWQTLFLLGKIAHQHSQECYMTSVEDTSIEGDK